MTTTLPALAGADHSTFVRLAREIAMDILPLEDILKSHGVSEDRWQYIKSNEEFLKLLRSECEAWNSALNTSERVKLKSMAFIEEALPEFFGRAHDKQEPLSAKVELMKTVAKLAGLGNSTVDTATTGERFQVTINLGADHSLKIEKEVTSKVIDHQE